MSTYSERFSPKEMADGTWAVWADNVCAIAASITGLKEDEARRRADVLNRAAAGLPDKAVAHTLGRIELMLKAMTSHPRTWGSDESLWLQAILLTNVRRALTAPDEDTNDSYFIFKVMNRFTNRVSGERKCTMIYAQLAEQGRSAELPAVIAEWVEETRTTPAVTLPEGSVENLSAKLADVLLENHAARSHAVALQAKLDAATAFCRADQRHALLAKVQPATLEAYLAAHGWERCPVGGTSREWALDPHYVRVPLHPDFRDYSARVSDVIEGICGAEHRAPFEVYLDVIATKPSSVG